ncbi:YfhD family protein [Salipaludibacillus aurantiacus]|uniref:YfhD-like protein n=1 Tax=Salipaludibacillus aurantiacus TaxID=1601833 RepID=A0A1H9SNB5_9BACI|nr:YfhD family protein [Salipaludibacillus aurantiacus]SER85863.1 YfhD-like protein [Salipaludibacillus aurantiacus]
MMRNRHEKNNQVTIKQENKDVEYNKEMADIEDREAVARAEAAAQRVDKENI